ncbi:MAG: RHS repeat-associated core domain-containing protein [Planctomycetota bacterium]
MSTGTQRSSFTAVQCQAGSLHRCDERRYYYLPSWQLAEEHIDEIDPSGPSDGYDGTVDRVSQQFWGQRYIDDAVAKRLMDTADSQSGDGFETVGGDVFFYITDAQFSVRALATDDGLVTRRVDYTSYGTARQRPSSDIAGPFGLSSSTDTTAYVAASGSDIGDAAYRADVDLVAPYGTIDSADQTAWTSIYFDVTNFTSERLSVLRDLDTLDADNHIGYAGYCFDAELACYGVRHREYDPDLGRWLTRDPIGYIDGFNRYQMVLSNPLQLVDPIGLSACQPERDPDDASESEKCREVCDMTGENRRRVQGAAICIDGQKKICNCASQRPTDPNFASLQDRFIECLSRCEKLHFPNFDCGPNDNTVPNELCAREYSESIVAECMLTCIESFDCSQLDPQFQGDCQRTKSSVEDVFEFWSERFEKCIEQNVLPGPQIIWHMLFDDARELP